MNIKIILKGYVTDNAEFKIQNIKKIESNKVNLEQNLKYNRKVLVNIYASETNLVLKEMMKQDTKEIVTNLDIYVDIEETGKVIFTIKEQDLKEYYKNYKDKYIAILVRTIEDK